MATDFLGAFGRAVRQFRQDRGMTQAELAARLSLGRTSVTNLENGQQSPPLSMLPEIASALGVDPLSLVANALGDSRSTEEGRLSASVHDEDLRRWAGQVIGETITGQSPRGQSPRGSSQRTRQRRPT
jgi:transcriptional regulator with XRE-family HTH domain